MTGIDRRLASWGLLAAAAIGPVKVQSDVRSGVSSGWTWQASATRVVLAPPADAVRQTEGQLRPIQIDYHVNDPSQPEVLHHLKFAPDAPMPIRAEMILDDQPAGSFDLAGIAGPEAIFLSERLETVEDLTRSTVAMTTYRLTYGDGTTATYQVETARLASAATDAGAAWRDLSLRAEDCVLTSATCGLGGLPDDCFELAWARGLRDNWLAQRPRGPAPIARYRREAPRLLRRLAARPDARARLARFYWSGALPAAILSRAGRPRLTLRLYVTGYLALSRSARTVVSAPGPETAAV